jgi:hypothetical protein
MLERRAKEDFSLRTEITGSDSGPIAIETQFERDLATLIAMRRRLGRGRSRRR